MKYYAPVLIIIRFISVAVVCFYAYILIYVLVMASMGATPSYGMERAIEMSRDRAIKESISKMVIGMALYFAAPPLSRIITRGSDHR